MIEDVPVTVDFRRMDHARGMSNDRLYMTVDEQRLALLDAGFTDVTQVLLKSGLVLHRAVRS